MYVYVIGVSSGILCLGRERIDYVKQTAPRLGVLPQEILEILNNGLIKRDLVLGSSHCWPIFILVTVIATCTCTCITGDPSFS